MPRSIIRIAIVILCYLNTDLVLANALVSENSFENWTVRCESAGSGQQTDCILLQNMVLKTGGEPILEFAVGYAPEDGVPTVILSLPLGISLPPGISIQIDEGDTTSFPIERCEPDGCRAGMKLREATIEQLKRADHLNITFHDNQRQPISVRLSLDGFAAGFKTLSVGTQRRRFRGGLQGPARLK